MRLENSIRNASVALMGRILELLLTYLSRIFVVYFLGIEYLGVNGLFTNILYLLSSAELGINYALIYAMYKPMATNDKIKLAGIANFYKKTYRFIGMIILMAGLFLTPYLDKIIAGDSNNIKNLYILYLLSLSNAVIPYFIASSKSLISVAQKDYILSLLDSIYKIFQTVLQIAILYISRNYVYFVTIQTFVTMIRCINIYCIARKKYPFLVSYKSVHISDKEKADIYNNVKALVIANLSGVIFSGTDNIIISSFIGLAAVGIFSNYMMIIDALGSIISLCINSVTASLGNLAVLSDAENVYERYKQILMLTFLGASLCSNVCMTVIKDFITLTFGSEFTLNQITVFMVILNFFLTCTRRPTLIFRNVLGLFRPDRYKGLAECVLNLVLSILLVQKLGIMGVILGSVISTICISVWIEPWVLFRFGFQRCFKDYWQYSVPLFLFGIISFIVSFFFLANLEGDFLWKIILKVLLNLAITSGLFIAFFRKTYEFTVLWETFVGVCRKVVRNCLYH